MFVITFFTRVLTFTSTKGAGSLPRSHHVVPPCFNRSPEQTNKALRVFAFEALTVGGEVFCVVNGNLQLHI